MATAQLMAKWSPGPIYQVGSEEKYSSAPKFGFGTAKKNPLDIKPPYYEEAVTVNYISAHFIG